MREIEVEQPENAKFRAIDYEHFKKLIVRIAALGQSHLGGQKQDLLDQFLEEETKKKKEDQEWKDRLIKKYEKDRSNWKKFENQNIDERNDNDDFEWADQTKDLTGFDALNKKGAKPPRHKYMTPDLKGQTLKKS